MKNTLDIVKRVFAIVVAVIAVAVMIFTIISVTTFNRNDRSIFGYKMFIVLSDSMKSTDFAAGDIVVVKSVDPTTLKEGDIIAYSSQNPDNFGETVTHKIRKKTVDANGDAGFITYGTSTGTDDEMVVTYPYINGKYKFRLPKVGSFFQFLQTTPGYIICVLIPFLLLIGMQGLNTVKLFRRYRREQMRAMKEERAKLEAERRKSERMMAELMQLKAQMTGGNSPYIRNNGNAVNFRNGGNMRNAQNNGNKRNVVSAGNANVRNTANKGNTVNRTNTRNAGNVNNTNRSADKSPTEKQ